MDTFRKKRLEIVIERTLERRLLALLEKEGALGYTVLPVLAGKGTRGTWREDSMSPANQMCMVLVVTDAARAERVAAAAYSLIGDYAGIVLVSDVDVFRGDRF